MKKDSKKRKKESDLFRPRPIRPRTTLPRTPSGTPVAFGVAAQVVGQMSVASMQHELTVAAFTPSLHVSLCMSCFHDFV